MAGRAVTVYVWWDVEWVVFMSSISPPSQKKYERERWAFARVILSKGLKLCLYLPSRSQENL